MGPPPVRHVPGVLAIHGSYAVGVRGPRAGARAANRQASGRRQPVWLVLVHSLAGRSDVDRCHSVPLLLGFDTSRRQMCCAVAVAGSYRLVHHARPRARRQSAENAIVDLEMCIYFYKIGGQFN